MAHPLEPEKIEDMFKLYQQGESIQSIGITCAVSRTTVQKYANRDRWLERKSKIVKKAENKLNDEYAKRQARHINISRVLQNIGLKQFIDPKTGKIKDKLDLKAKDAILALVQGANLEREILGDADSTKQGDITINIQMIQVGTEEPKTRGVENVVIQPDTPPDA